MILPLNHVAATFVEWGEMAAAVRLTFPLLSIVSPAIPGMPFNFLNNSMSKSSDADKIATSMNEDHINLVFILFFVI